MSTFFKANNTFFNTATINAVAGSVNYFEGAAVILFIAGSNEGVELSLSKSEADNLNQILIGDGFVSTGDWIFVNTSRILKADDSYDPTVFFADGFSIQGGGLGADDPLFKFLQSADTVG